MSKTTLLLLLSLPAALAAGYLLGGGMPPSAPRAANAAAPPAFHDLRINPVETYIDLIEPEAPEVVELAKRLGSYEEAYRFVCDEIAFAPFVPPGPVRETLNHGMGSCLGKAVLLASLYRALGLAKEDVRVVMGLVVTPDGLADHVWIDLELRGTCLQQDPSGMLGRFGFAQFPETRYVDTYVMKENFCFNDRDFAVVSQLNRFRDAAPP